MSFRKEKYLSFNQSTLSPQTDFLTGKSNEDIRSLFRETLYGGVHGFCFSIYEEGQKPGDIISAEQVRKRMQILKPYTAWVRSFSCVEGNELVPKIDNLISLAKEGYVDIAVVGNEVLYRKDLTEEELLDYIEEVKNAIPAGIPVGYVDAYYEFVQCQRITEACDVILCNCYPYWEGTDFDHSLQHMQHMYNQATMAANGKKVIITETGWPSKGESLGDAVPSELNAMTYFINTQKWAKSDNIEVFYFSSFDESWKVGAEGVVGAYWGIWDKTEQLKFNNEHI